MRITITDLRKELDALNSKLEHSSLPFRFKAQGRNGYQAVDLYNITGSCLRNVGCGSSKEVIGYTQQEYYYINSYYEGLFEFSRKRDVNGNTRLVVHSRLAGGFSVQTLGNLPEIHRALISGTVPDKSLIIRELNKYLIKFGTKRQKTIMQLL